MLPKTRRNWILTVLVTLLLGGGLSAPLSAQEAKDPRTATDEPISNLKEFQRKLDFMAKRLAEVRVEEQAGAKVGEDSITVKQHLADVADVRDEFTRCYAAAQKAMEEKRASGTATKEDLARFEALEAHCASILAKLNHMHLGATKMSMADHKTTWLVGALDAHRQGMAELEALAAQCPMMMREAIGSASTAEAPAAPAHAASIAIDDPSVHLKEFQRKLDFMAARLAEVKVDTDQGPDLREGGITVAQHAADVAAVRDEFEKCVAGIKKRIADKEASGTATRSDRSQFKRCVKMCDSILAKLNNMHVNASVMTEADHTTTWVLDGMEKHKKAVAEVQKMAGECSEILHETLSRSAINP